MTKVLVQFGQSKYKAIAESDWPDYYRGQSFIFVIFLGYVLYWYLQGGYRIPLLGTIRFEFLVGATLSAFSIPTYFTNPDRERCNVSTWVTLLFITMLIMILFSYVPAFSFNLFIDRVVKFALLGFFIASFVTTPRRLRWFIGVFLFAFFKMGQEGFLGTITGSLIWENQGIPRLHGPTPIYGHPNSFSGMALGFLPFLFYFYNIVPWYLRIILIIQIVFALNILLCTGSRTGYIGFIAALGFLVWNSKSRIRTILFILAAGFVATPWIPKDYIGRFESITTQKDKEGHSTDLRKEILRDAWQVFISAPWGIGVGAFPAVRHDRFGRIQDTHNLYLEIATNLGIQGLIAFFGLITAISRALLQLINSVNQQIDLVKRALVGTSLQSPVSWRLQEQMKDLQIMRATSLSVLMFLVIRLALGLFGMDLYEIYWWFALGTTVAIWNLNTVARRRTNILCCAA